MEALLTLNHPDYKLMVYCPSYDKIFKKAANLHACKAE